MSSGQAKSCCSCGCLVSTAISAIFLWLAFRILTPTCSIENFDVFALQKTPNNNSIHYDLKLKNRNFNKGIYYDALNLTFYYKPNRSNFPVGNVTIDSFYQGFWKSTHRVGDIEPKGVNLKNANGDAVFRVELATEVRYRSPLWKTKRHSLVVGADLKVNDQGSLIKGKGNNGIKLSSAPGRRMSWISVGGILGTLFFIHSL
ncbi:protein NDR1-like [Silene latifolia]|uniref:protein NDR1-like n=1 Tax=Silene latifolia TaxID=37657 RepID=UPI003D7848F3